jgi:hypothetical protein
MNLLLQNLSCRSRCEKEQWEVRREHEEENARKPVKDVNKNDGKATPIYSAETPVIIRGKKFTTGWVSGPSELDSQ